MLSDINFSSSPLTIVGCHTVIRVQFRLSVHTGFRVVAHRFRSLLRCVFLILLMSIRRTARQSVRLGFFLFSFIFFCFLSFRTLMISFHVFTSNLSIRTSSFSFLFCQGTSSTTTTTCTMPASSSTSLAVQVSSVMFDAINTGQENDDTSSIMNALTALSQVASSQSNSADQTAWIAL